MIYNYEIINPVTNRKSPYLDGKGFIIAPAINKNYRYYIEVRRYNNNTLCYEYFILLSTTKFDNQCKKCRVDDYGRLKVKLGKELYDIAKEEMIATGNVSFVYNETENDYDVWELG